MLCAVVGMVGLGAPASAAAEAPAASTPATDALPAAAFSSPVPLPLSVLAPFAAPAHRYGPGHRGVDLAAAAGTPVRAAGPGVVVFAGPVAGRPVVSIDHEGGLRTTYEPVTAAVAVGTRVSGGTVIGVLSPGHPGCPGLDCLHWGARLPDRTYLDPLALLRAWPVRLWPWTDP